MSVPMPEAAPREYVGFWARFLAFIIDSVIACALIAPVAWLVFGGRTMEALGDPTNAASNLLQTLIGAALFIGMWIMTSSDPGKMIVSAEIVDAKTFGKPANWQFVVRYLGYFVSMLCLFIGFLWIAFDARKQGWHDKLAGTVVVKKRP